MLVAAAMAIGLAGYYGPWVPHRAAGLVVVGLDLGEYVKFLPQVASGAVRLHRELFYLPLLAGSVSGALFASRRALPSWGRTLSALAAIPLALAMLPPAWNPAVLATAEFRIQVIAIAVCLLLIMPGIFLTRHLPDRQALAIIAMLAAAAAVIPAWEFLKVRPEIEQLYTHALPLGWGWWATLLGNLSASAVALASLITAAPDGPHPSQDGGRSTCFGYLDRPEEEQSPRQSSQQDQESPAAGRQL